MTVYEAIEELNQRKPNTLKDEDKVAWLSEVDGHVHRSIFLTHEGNPAGPRFRPYSCCDDMEKQLLVKEPYADLYFHYMAAKIDLANREPEGYNENMILYNQGYHEFDDYWTRTHMPLHAATRFRF